MDQLMDKLRAQQEALSLWLSRDPDYILDECGDILSVNECKAVTKQMNAHQQMQELLKIIFKKGEEPIKSFIGILKENQDRYQQLQQFFNPSSTDSSPPTVFADNNSVVTTRRITNTKAKSLSFSVEMEPGRQTSGSSAPAADYTAQGGSVICADKLDAVTVDGDINFYLAVKPSHSAADDSAAVSLQDPAVKMVFEHKVKLIECLMADPKYVLQHVDQKHIVTHREYQNLMHFSKPEDAVTNLIDLVIGKGQQAGAEFLQVLKDPEVLRSYPPLKGILNMDV